MATKITRVKKMLKIELPLEKPYLSRSGKVLLVAGTHGWRQTDIIYKGRTITVVASAYVRPTEKEIELFQKKHGDRKKTKR